MRNVVYIVLSLVLLTGCVGKQPRVNVNVSSFSELPNNLIDKTIYFLAYPQEKNDTLEWKSYRLIFEDNSEKVGFTITPMESADYIAFVSYGVNDGKMKTDSVSEPIFGSTFGGGYGIYSGTIYTMPAYGVVGSRTSTVSSEFFTRKIAMDIVLRETLLDEKPIKVYEGRLRSSGSCPQLREVIDEMVEALFQKFPNGSGKVTVPGVFDC